MTYLENDKIVWEVQGASKEDRWTEPMPVRFQVCAHFIRLKTYFAFLTYRKHSIEFGLFYLLWKSGIQCKCWKLLRSLTIHVSKLCFDDIENVFSIMTVVVAFPNWFYCYDERFSRYALLLEGKRMAAILYYWIVAYINQNNLMWSNWKKRMKIHLKTKREIVDFW